MEVIQYSQEERVTMINKIRKEFGLPTSEAPTHIIEGVEFSATLKRENLMAIRDLEMSEDDILIATFPKSGK